MKRLTLLGIFLLCQAAAVLVAIRTIWAIFTNPARAWRILVSYDRLSNAATNGDDRETISSRANRARSEGRRWGCVLCKLLDHIQPNHCANSAGV